MFRNKFILTITLLLFSLISSCNDKKEKKQTAPILEETLNEENQIDESFENKLSLLSVIPIETSENCLISQINKMILLEDKILILNNKREVLILNRENGNLTNKIQRKGNGPYEYSKILDISFYKEKKSILLYTDAQELLSFDLDGTPNEQPLRTEHLYTNVSCKNHLLYFYHPFEKGKDIIRIYSLQKKEWLSSLGEKMEEYNFFVRIAGSGLLSSQSVWYANPFQNFISKIEGEKLSDSYTLNLKNFVNKKNVLSLNSNNSSNFIFDSRKNNICYGFTSIRETQNNIYLKSNLDELININKNKKSYTIYKHIIDKRISSSSTIRYIGHDGEEDILIFYIETKNLSRDEELANFIRQNFPNKNINEESNPILLFYKES